MKQQFTINPLATAILTLLFGSTVSSYADSKENASDVTNQALDRAIQQDNNPALAELYPGQQFFEQYYVSKSAPEAQQRSNFAPSARFCSNTWLTPISPDTKAVAPEEATSVITADRAYYNPNGDSELEGNVVIDQQGRMVRANSIVIDKTQTHAKAQGNVQLAQAGLIAQSDLIDYNLKNQTGNLTNSYYIAEATHAHGYAERIERTSPNILQLYNATYSTCPPEQSPTWKIQSNEIELNQETGRGVTRGTKLYIKDTPVMAVPYFNFPIDDRRTTGVLTPSFGFTNDGGPELAVPVYLNLAPNYDTTLTPRYISDRGFMAEGEFRYLTENYGGGRLWGGYLASDRKRNDEDRKDLHLEHSWKINEQWKTNLDYNYVSDKDFFADLDSNPNTRTELNQRRAWELNYANGIPGLKAQLKTEYFQTLDPDVSDIDRPYARLPQLLVNYITGNPQGLEYEFNNDTAYFKKKINDIGGLSNLPQDGDLVYQPSGTRVYNELSARYNFRNQWSFLVPQATVRSLNTFYDQNTIDRISEDQRQNSKDNAVVVPEFTVDAGLTFEKDGKFLQTLSPRAFYAYAPHRSQDKYPNFDSTAASLNYDQLFSPRRFYGHDRLEDNNFLSLGLSYSLFDDVGLERLRASIGQSYFFEDRKVTLNRSQNDPFNTESQTGPVISVASQLSQNFTVNANAMWMSNGDNAQRDLQVYYTGDKGNLYNFGYFNRKQLLDRQQHYDQITASFIQPVKDNWNLMGHVQYDLDNSVAREYLLGLNYESCCWGVSVYGRAYYNDLDDVNAPDTKQKRAIMAAFTLNGLGSFNNKLSSLLENRILGFDKVKRNWTN